MLLVVAKVSHMCLFSLPRVLHFVIVLIRVLQRGEIIIGGEDCKTDAFLLYARRGNLNHSLKDFSEIDALSYHLCLPGLI